MSNKFLKKILKNIKINESTISLILGTLVVIVVGSLVINYFRHTGKTLDAGITPIVTEKVESDQLPTTYKVAAGDSLWKIAERYYQSGYNWVDISEANGLTSPDAIDTDQELTIPLVDSRKITVAQTAQIEEPTISISGESYTVVEGDNLWNISVRAYGDGYQWVIIAHENELTNPNLIHPGNIIKLPRD